MLIYITRLIGAFFATICLSFIFNVSKKNIITCGIIGASGWLIYILLTCNDSSKILYPTFIASLWVSLLSHIMARIRKTPVTHYFIPGIIPFVPGAGMFNFVYSIIEEKNSSAEFYLIQTLEIAGIIALSIFIVDSIFRLTAKWPKK